MCVLRLNRVLFSHLRRLVRVKFSNAVFESFSVMLFLFRLSAVIYKPAIGYRLSTCEFSVAQYCYTVCTRKSRVAHSRRLRVIFVTASKPIYHVRIKIKMWLKTHAGPLISSSYDYRTVNIVAAAYQYCCWRVRIKTYYFSHTVYTLKYLAEIIFWQFQKIKKNKNKLVFRFNII